MRWQNVVQVGIIPATVNTDLQKRPTKRIQKRKVIEKNEIIAVFL